MVTPTPEQLTEMARATPSRRMVYLRCTECGREWSQPATSGLCPSCHSPNVVSDGERISAYQRV